MPDPLDPAHLTPAASLNRVRIVDLPGLSLDPDVRGRTGYELLSTQALAAVIRPHAARTRACASHAAVILLGTALGVGFVPRGAASLRPLAQGFARESSPAASAARASVPLN